MNKLLLLILIAISLLSCKRTGDEFDATGHFEATEITISAEAAGKIVELNLDEGTTLYRDKKIGFIDTTQLYLKLEQLKATRIATQSGIQDIEKQIAPNREQIAMQKRELKRTENLLKSKSATQKQYDDIKSAIATLESQVAAMVSTLTNSNNSIKSQVEALKIQEKQVKDQISKSIISSPIDGIVLEKYSEQGEFTATGKPLFKVADIERMFLRAYVTSTQLESIKLNQSVKVFSDYGSESSREYDGKIIWISGRAEFSPKNIQTKDERANLVYEIKISLENDGFIKIGMYGLVKF